MNEQELPFGTEFKNAWQEWINWRKEMRFKKYAPSGLKKTLTHLVNIANNNEQTAIDIINQSIIQNYQGLFPLKNNNGKSITNNQQEQLNQVYASIKQTVAGGK